MGVNLLYLKKVTYTKSYGFKRAESIGAVLNIILLLLVSIFLFTQGIMRIQNPRPVSGSVIVWISLIAFMANSIAVIILHKGAASDLSIKTVTVHLMADAISSFSIIVTGVILHFTNWYILDPIISIVIAFFILWNCWEIMREAFNISHVTIQPETQKVENPATLCQEY